ncbi:MAG: GNAT family N-acetyltransferase, partial [Gammaproteobacteria bacterium]|nr:GNAT family N-acetyltransferase [Gammaproteobacteria bacterium]
RLEQEIGHFLVAELDGVVVGCCAVYSYGEQAELACVAVHENFRKQSGMNIGAKLLAEAEKSAATQHARMLFVLTTQARDWFLEQGFSDASTDVLPLQKQSLYNWQRNSVVMVKPLKKQNT